ncbi:MAG: hypothetical protein EOP64_08685 [Sphingomonas sp.]|nr:MAG: hypothetical protein EOP64_08685 [Sphingomonas sp.]
MSKPLNDPIDRRMVPRREESLDKRLWWMRSRRTIIFLVVVLIDVLILLVVRYGTTNDSDAAGNGMAHAIDTALFELGGSTVCFVTFLYVIIPSRKIRFALTILMMLIAVALAVITA